MPKISMIAAMAKGNVIGMNNQMPWHLPADFAWFKEHTLGKPIVMGRKTYESIGRPLPNRLNIVMSRDPNLKIDGVICVNDLQSAIYAADAYDELMVIGGETIYQAFLPLAKYLYLTFVDTKLDGDAYFPSFSQEDWSLVSSQNYQKDLKNAYDMQFCIYKKSE